MNIIYTTLQQIQMNNWYAISNEMEIAKGKNKLKSFKEKMVAIKRRFLYFLRKQNR